MSPTFQSTENFHNFIFCTIFQIHKFLLHFFSNFRAFFKKGDVLCMFCSNFVEYWLIALATWTCGGCVMPLNCEMEPKNLENQLTLGKAKILVCDELNIADAIGKYSTLQK